MLKCVSKCFKCAFCTEFSVNHRIIMDNEFLAHIFLTCTNNISSLILFYKENGKGITLFFLHVNAIVKQHKNYLQWAKLPAVLKVFPFLLNS